MGETASNKKNLARNIRIGVLLTAIAGTLVFPEKVRSVVNWATIKHANFVVQNQTAMWQQEFFGISVLQYPNDLMMYQRVVWELKPDVIIETGTRTGGLTHYFSMLLEHSNPSAKIVTVDIDSKRWRDTVATRKELEHLRDRIVFIEGNSVAEETIRRVSEEIPPGAKVLVLLDSLHDKDHVLREMNLYSRMVTKGSYLIVTDTHLGGTPWIKDHGLGPLAAVHAFISQTDEFVIDKSRNRDKIGTAVEDGYLKRVE